MKQLSATEARRLILLIVFFLLGFACGVQFKNWQDMVVTVLLWLGF